MKKWAAWTMAGAIIDSRMQPEARAVGQITKNADGSADFQYNMAFGAQSFEMTLHLVCSASRLNRTLSEKNNIFSVDVLGANGCGGDSADHAHPRYRTGRLSDQT